MKTEQAAVAWGFTKLRTAILATGEEVSIFAAGALKSGEKLYVIAPTSEPDHFLAKTRSEMQEDRVYRPLVEEL